MDDLVVAAELRVLVRERIEAVRAARDDLAGPGLVQRLDVLLRQHREDELVPHPPRRVAGAGLGGPAPGAPLACRVQPSIALPRRTRALVRIYTSSIAPTP